MLIITLSVSNNGANSGSNATPSPQIHILDSRYMQTLHLD